MMSDLKGLAAACMASMALMALMIVPGLFMLPMIAEAQPMPQMVCSGGGVTGCFSCPGNPSPTGQGCNGITSPPAGWRVGFCQSTLAAMTCVQSSIDCGVWINCTTMKPTGGGCTTLGVCV